MSDLYNLQIEACVLSCFMINRSAVENFITEMSIDWFAPRKNQIVFSACETIFKRGDAVDGVTVLDEINKSIDSSKVVNEQYLMDLMAAIGFPDAMPSYVEILRKQWVKRNAVSIGKQISDLLHNVDMNTDEIVSRVHTLAQSVESGKSDQWQKSAFDYAVDLFQTLESRNAAFEKNIQLSDGIQTGFIALDNKLSYIEKQDLVIIGGRPSMGKTTFAQNILADVAINQRKPVLMMSAEMSGKSIIERLTGQLSEVALGDIRCGNLSDKWEEITKANMILKNAPIEINEQPTPTVFDVRKAARRTIAKHGSIGAIFVDYLQIMKPHTNYNNPVKDIGEISKELKATAKLFNCPVFALSQLSRNLENRPNKRPVNSDLRDSGQIEQDADIIIMLYRDEVYNKESKDIGIAEAIITKCRNGSTGTARLASNLAYSCFEDLSMGWEEAKGGAV